MSFVFLHRHLTVVGACWIVAGYGGLVNVDPIVVQSSEVVGGDDTTLYRATGRPWPSRAVCVLRLMPLIR